MMVVTGVARCHIYPKVYEFIVIASQVICILVICYWVVLWTGNSERKHDHHRKEKRREQITSKYADKYSRNDNKDDYEDDDEDDDDEWLELSETSFTGLGQDDPKLISYVRKHMRSPAPRTEPYYLWKPEVQDFSQFGQATYVTEVLRDMRNGFFIELGAADGEELSNTLMLERNFEWTGLLIEPEPAYYNMIISKNRKAYSINAGVSLDTIAKYAHYKPALGLGRIDDVAPDTIAIKTFPLYTMLLALNVFHIDFFSLDVEGDELKVLQSMPWDKITIRLMCVETNHVDGGAPAIINFMVRRGYLFLGLREIDAWFGHPKLLNI